jgi:hypothetical protein
MTARKLDLHDLLFGIFLILVAGGALLATKDLNVGSAAEMGAGYMPRAISLILMGFGVFFTARGIFWGEGRGIERVHLRPLLGIMVAVAVFAFLAESAGLVLAALSTVVIAGFAGPEHRFVEGVLFSLVLTACAVLLFVRVLSLPIPVWPW